MKTLLLATRNKGKAREFQELVFDLGFKVENLNMFLDAPEVEETGTTFKENALLKARTIAKWSGKPTLADDSGLEVEYLDGKPGVFSARFAGENATDEENNRKLLELLSGVPAKKRSARFCCVLALVTPRGQEEVVEGTCEGMILNEPRGDKGFGYDPLFYLTEYNATFAQLGSEVKNKISHRAKAFKKMKEILKELKL